MPFTGDKHSVKVSSKENTRLFAVNKLIRVGLNHLSPTTDLVQFIATLAAVAEGPRHRRCARAVESDNAVNDITLCSVKTNRHSLTAYSTHQGLLRISSADLTMRHSNCTIDMTIELCVLRCVMRFVTDFP